MPPLNDTFQLLIITLITLPEQSAHLFHMHHSLSNNVRVRPNDLLNADSCLIFLINRKDGWTNALVTAELASWKLGHKLEYR